MTLTDANSVGQHAAKLGLITLPQLQEGMEELGKGQSDPEALLRIMERKGYMTPWQSMKLMRGDSQGFFYGGYRILYKIASGSFGRVYRADDPQSGTIVAVKVLRSRWTDKPKDIEMFEREGKVGMTMKHPNIVEILAVNCDKKSKQFYIVMEFVEGGNLKDFLKIRKVLTPLESLKIIEDAASGLAYAFGKGITHRDMKLTNILISSQGSAKLVDFGLATLNETLHKDEKSRSERTVDYAGLEKATGVETGDTRSDIYFLGAVLYELLTGRSPLEKSKNPHERMRSYRFTSVRPMTSDEVQAPPSVFRLVENMMTLDPQRRFQTPSQLLEAIREVRLELEGKTSDKKALSERSVFIVQGDLRLQDVMRENFKKHGFRVFMAADPVRALDRFRQRPYEALIIDCGTVGEDGLFIFDRIMSEAERVNRDCVGALLLSEDQKSWASKITKRKNVTVLVRPVTMKQLRHALRLLFE